jgi:solute carrier family 45 protein 1/2/4
MENGKKEIRVIYAATGLSWFGWFSALIYQTHFVASEVLGGASAETLRRATQGLTLGAILSGIASLTLPMLIGNSVLNLWLLWSAGCGLLALLLLGSVAVKYMQQGTLGIFWLGAFGLVHAVSNTAPYALVSLCKVSSGRALGVLNIFVCLPQVAVALVSGPLNATAASDLPAFLCGGLAALGAALLLRAQAQAFLYHSIL